MSDEKASFNNDSEKNAGVFQLSDQQKPFPESKEPCNQPLLGPPGPYNQQFQGPPGPYNPQFPGPPGPYNQQFQGPPRPYPGQQAPPYSGPYAPQHMAVQPTLVQPIYIANRSFLSFTGAIVLSCFVYWCCGWLCGLIAFILAMVGKTSAANGDSQTARSLLTSSYVLSGIGIVVGIATIIFVVVYYTRVRKYDSGCYYNNVYLCK